ncbi:unnamed protein product [Calypogeia fissa]
MASAVLFPTLASMASVANAASLRWPASVALLRYPLAAPGGGVGYHPPALCGIGGWRPSAARPKSSRPAVVQRDDDVDSLSSEKQEQEMELQSVMLEESIANLDRGNLESPSSSTAAPPRKLEQRMARRKNEQRTYLFAALASTTGFTALSAAAVVYRFWWQMPESGEIPYPEVFGTFSLAVGAAIAMEYWARWAHKALWHASLWHMHESHHKPRDGPFEANDIFAVINAVPAIGLG